MAASRLVGIAGCAVIAFGGGVMAPTGTHAAVGSTSAQHYYQLVQYPAAGFGGFYRQTNDAKKSIDMEMYELADATEEADLAAAARRGVDVRVLLDKAYNGGSVNASAYRYLASHHVHVRWASSNDIFHIKTTTFDGRTSDVSSANLTARYYSDTRDAEIVDTNPKQVAAISKTFDHDWHSRTPTHTVSAAGLVWSPDSAAGSAETAMADEISSARHSVDFESEELSDYTIYDALAADARRGVRCHIVMTNSSDWDSAFRKVTAAGCDVRVYPDTSDALYIHEKLVLVDHGHHGQSMLIGSQNAGYGSLVYNRELSLLLSGSEAATPIKSATRTFAHDFSHARVVKG